MHSFYAYHIAPAAYSRQQISQSPQLYKPLLKHIVYVEDEDRFVRLMESSLLRINRCHVLIELETGEELLEYLGGNEPHVKPDLVILDINLPGKSGIQVARYLKQLPSYTQTPIVLFSSNKNALDTITCQRIGVDIVQKPTDEALHLASTKKLLSYCNY